MQQLLGGGDKGPMQARYDRLEQALVDYFQDGVSWKKRVLERVHAHVCAGQRAQTFDAAQGRVKSAILDHESWFTFFFDHHHHPSSIQSPASGIRAHLGSIHRPERMLLLMLRLGAKKSAYATLRGFWAFFERRLRRSGVRIGFVQGYICRGAFGNPGFGLPSRKKFFDCWDAFCGPLNLRPVTRCNGQGKRFDGLFWPLYSWAAYVASRPALLEGLPTDGSVLEPS